MRARRLSALIVIAASVGSGTGCLRARNYLDRHGPRYTGSFVKAQPEPGLKVVSFNIRYAREIDRAIDLLRTNASLRGADVIALQEMDRTGVERIAEALGLAYVYYPAARHPKGRKDFGNAVLVRGEIEEDHKLPLPHPGRFGGMQRIAVSASARLEGHALRIYSTHLGTPKDVSSAARLDQIAAIVDDTRDVEGLVLIAGDFNDRSTAATALEEAGFTWLTRDVGRTIAWFSWDHVFVRGCSSTLARSGTVDSRGASDHRAVWVELPISTAQPAERPPIRPRVEASLGAATPRGGSPGPP